MYAMFNNINRAQFSIDTVFPAIQTATTVLATQALGRLGHYSVSVQSTVLISFTAALVSALANNFFTKAIYQYLALAASVGVGLVAHRFFYPGKALAAVANTKEILIISGILIAVKLVADNIDRIRTAEGKAKNAVVDAVDDVRERLAK